MEGVQKAYNSAMESAAKLGSYASSLEKAKSVSSSPSSSGFGSTSTYSGNQSQMLVTRSSSLINWSDHKHILFLDRVTECADAKMC